MPSSNPKSHFLRLAIGALLVLATGFSLALLQTDGPGYAAPPPAPGAKHRTATTTPTPTPTGQDSAVTTTNVADEVDVDPFIGFESTEASLVGAFLPDFCADTIVAPGGEAWALNASYFSVGGSGRYGETTLYVQRCVGDFQPWNPADSTNDSGVFRLLPPASVALLQPDLESPITRALIRPDIAALVLATPVPLDVAPIIAPIFVTPIAPIIPTIEAPERFEQMPFTSATLRMPSGQEIALGLVRSDRPDLWKYTFLVNSPSGTYQLLLVSGGNAQTRQIIVQGAARIYTTDGNNNLARTFISPGDAVIHFADFWKGREVAVILYRIVKTLDTDIFSRDSLAEIGRWSFLPGDEPLRERLSQRVDLGLGPTYGSFVMLACYVDECNKMPQISLTSQQVIWPQMVIGTVYIEPDASVLTLPARFEIIRFAPGAVDASVDLTLSDSNPAGYLFSASAGQRVNIQLDTPNVQVYVLEPSGDLLLPTGQGEAVWEFTLQQSGQHRLIVFGVEDGHMLITIPPGSDSSVQPPTATATSTPTFTPTSKPTEPPDTSLYDTLAEKMAAADTPNDYPNRANALVEHLLAHLPDFDETGIGAVTIEDALGRADVGDRINGIVDKVWEDWSRDSSSPLNDSPDQQSRFRQLVIRLIQGSIGTLSSQEQRAILNWLTRSENPRVWSGNPNGVIGAINREIFP